MNVWVENSVSCSFFANFFVYIGTACKKNNNVYGAIQCYTEYNIEI